ncbi:MAG TPA: alpha/beta fold hydrolase, partial [candidate division Zixibacteria bacterium]|nr:alpha/beta fold hydrolase [candidate division Zixibacteria bacterium]
MLHSIWPRTGAAAVLLVVLAFACRGGGEGGPADASAALRVDSALSTDSVPIYFEVHGSGDTALVFVHGWGIDGSFWEKQIPAFSDSYTVVTLDLAGHGRSGKNRAAWTPHAYGADVVAVLDAAGIAHAFLVGHSMGGVIIAEAARLAPDRVIALIGADTYQDFRERWTPDQAEQFLAPFRRNYDSTVAWFASVMLPENVDTAIAYRIIRSFQADDPAVGLATLGNLLVYDALPVLREAGKPIRAVSSDSYPTNLA